MKKLIKGAVAPLLVCNVLPWHQQFRLLTA